MHVIADVKKNEMLRDAQADKIPKKKFGMGRMQGKNNDRSFCRRQTMNC